MTKYLVSGTIQFLDDFFYVTTGEGLSRNAIPEEFLNELLHVAAERMVN